LIHCCDARRTSLRPDAAPARIDRPSSSEGSNVLEQPSPLSPLNSPLCRLADGAADRRGRLWPLCHIAFVRPTFRESDWQLYQAVNERFANALVQEAKTDNPIVLVHDYHFAGAADDPQQARRRDQRAA
jgi:hypothetical protein